jgi:hypothetical protein
MYVHVICFLGNPFFLLSFFPSLPTHCRTLPEAQVMMPRLLPSGRARGILARDGAALRSAAGFGAIAFSRWEAQYQSKLLPPFFSDAQQKGLSDRNVHARATTRTFADAEAINPGAINLGPRGIVRRQGVRHEARLGLEIARRLR